MTNRCNFTNINSSILIVSFIAAVGGGCSSHREASGGTAYYSDYSGSASRTGSSYDASAYPPSAESRQTAPAAPNAGAAQSSTSADKGAAPAGSSSAQAMKGSEVSIPLYEEKVSIGKQEVDAGTVRLKKVVRTETVNQPLELRRETLTIDRQPGAGAQAAQSTAQPATQDQGKAFQEQEFTIQLHREEPMIQTQVVESGRIVAQKQSQSEQTTVQRQVRKEDVSIDKGNAQGVNVSESVGAAASPSGQSQGASSSEDKSTSSQGASSSPQGSSSAAASSSGPITDLKSFNQTTDASSMTGRGVQLSGVEVQEVISSSLIAVGDDSGSRVYVHLKEAMEDIKTGDKINLNGTVKEPSAGTSITAALGSETSQKLKSQPFFVEAQSAQKTSQ